MKSNEEWKDQLSPMEYHVAREKGTERAFTGRFWNHKEAGTYTCVCCGEPLFDSATKYDSGSGWPSFYDAVERQSIAEHTDRSHGMVRTEVTCAKCDAHLGHLFPDGPRPTGMRYCINSASLNFVPIAQFGKQKEASPHGQGRATATLGAGCFWCVEAVFQQLDGVLSVTSGYMGGHVKNPAYREVCNGTTGHAEVAQIVYDPQRIGFADLLEVFWQTHDPTTLNRQGADVGTQYRSVIFYHDETQRSLAEELKQKLNAERAWPNPVVTEIAPATQFYPAEDYHHNYFLLHPEQAYCRAVIAPKVAKFKKAFAGKLKA